MLCSPNDEVIPANQSIIIRALAQNKQVVRKVLLLDASAVGGAPAEDNPEFDVPSWDNDKNSKLRIPGRYALFMHLINMTC